MSANRFPAHILSTQTLSQKWSKAPFALLPSGATADLELYRQAREQAEAALRPQSSSRLNLFAVMN